MLFPRRCSTIQALELSFGLSRTSKESRRKGKIQLIDATGLKSPLRKNLGEKKLRIYAGNQWTNTSGLYGF